MDNIYLELNSVSKKYLNVSYTFILSKGDLICVSGANGSGKTTLIKLILDFIKPDTGVIKWKKNLKMSYLPERATLPGFQSAISYLKEIYELDKTNWDEDFLCELNIPLNKKISKLSKGNKQKVSLFRTFLGRSDVIILDEPFSGLDDKMVKVLKRKIIKEKENGKAFLISTHKPKEFNKLKTKEIILC